MKIFMEVWMCITVKSIEFINNFNDFHVRTFFSIRIKTPLSNLVENPVQFFFYCHLFKIVYSKFSNFKKLSMLKLLSVDTKLSGLMLLGAGIVANVPPLAVRAGN